MSMRHWMTVVLLSLLSLPGLAAPRSEPVTWRESGTTMRGTLVWDDAAPGPRPGLLMLPNWLGPNAAAVAKARTIAGKDYVILVADMYGESVRPKDTAEAMTAVKPFYADRALMTRHVQAAWQALQATAATHPGVVDRKRLGVIGFCFGGSAALQLARSGVAPSGGIVTFHAGLNPDDPAKAANLRSRLLVLNGADDPNTKGEVEALFAELRASPSDWQFVNFGGAVHCFAEPDAHSPPGCVYDPRAARRAFRLMHAFFDEVFAAPARDG
jgi:dienelactone hydrolase